MQTGFLKLCKSKVDQCKSARVLVEQEVARLDVAMDDSSLMLQIKQDPVDHEVCATFIIVSYNVLQRKEQCADVVLHVLGRELKKILDKQLR